MIRKKRMSKGIAKILSGLLVFGMVAGLVPAAPGGTVHAKASEISGQNVTTAENPEHKHCVCGTEELSVEGHTHDKEQTWKGISNLNDITGEGYYYLTQDVTINSAWKCSNDVALCLNGHSITCNASDSDTIVIDSGKTFTLTDCQKTAGKITHGESKTGRGICNNSGTFQMYEGTISGNTGLYGGGIYNSSGTFQMYKGTISGNTGSMYGGGICNNRGNFQMYEGTIFGNTGIYGGGVNSIGGTFNMYGGTITGNIGSTAANCYNCGGGGVYNNGSEFNMYGGVISGNNSEDCGGGVFCHNGGSFNMFGGEITDNKSTSDGGGVYFASTGSFNMKGTVNITKNKVGEIDNNLYLCEGKQVSASGLTSEARIGVTTAIVPTDTSAVPITSDDVSANCFSSDNSDYETTIDENNKVVLKKKAAATYTIQATVSGGNGTISPSGSVSVNKDKDKEFTITPNEGYVIASLKVDGTEVENPSNTYTFTNVTNNHTIVVSFKAKDVVPPIVEKPKIITQPQPASVKAGETATFTVNATGTDLKYQWQVNKNDNAGFVNIDGATSESYKFNVASAEFNGYQYQCVVSNQSGSDTSDPVTLNVTENSTPEPNPNPMPNPKPEPTPTPTPTPNPTPEVTTPTPDPAPATSTPAASTTTAPASSASSAPAQVTYDILDGAGSSWTQNTDGSLAIRGSGEVSKFREVKVDGVTVDPVNYTVTEGSTIITFKPEYLKSLSAGNHSFELVWTDGTAATNFTVAENTDQSAKSPKTGEDFSMALCIALLMVSCAGLAGIFAKRKRNHAR
ncbi:InlB B-repeat-containing protein [Roseburia inulinivorans]